MNRTSPALLLLPLLALWWGSCQSERAVLPAERLAPDRPNILWIVAEDLSPVLPMYGDSTVRTPNLHRLVERGTVYQNCFSPSPVCAPSRAALATGMYPISIGAHNMRTQWNRAYLNAVGLEPYEVVPPEGVRMLSERLREHGYYCTNNAKTDYQFKPTLLAWDESSNYAHYRDRAPGQPFFAVFNLEVTHESRLWMPASRDMLRFEADSFPDRRRPSTGFSDNIPTMRWNLPANHELPLPPYLIDDDSTRWTVRRAYSNIITLDRQIGRLLDQLEEMGELDRTIVFFYGDHGGPLPRQKRLLFDSGLRAPLIVSYPGSWDDGQRDSSLVSFVDFVPTVFELTGVPLPDYLQGHSFADRKTPPRRYLHAAADRFDAIPDRSRAVTDGRWKYIRNYHPERPYYPPITFRENIPAMRSLLRARDAGTLSATQALWFRTTKPAEELFDTQFDPHEVRNLAGQPDYADKLVELRTEMDRFLAEVGDLGARSERAVVDGFQVDGKQPPCTPPNRTADGRVVSTTPGSTVGFRRLDSVYVTENTWEIAGSILPADSVRLCVDRIGWIPWVEQ